MKQGWEVKKLGDVCVFNKEQDKHHDLPYVGLEHIESNTARFIGSTDPQPMKSSTFRFSSDHILYGRLRPYLNKVIAPDFYGHCSTEIFPIKPNKGLLREYLLYWFLSDETVEKISSTTTGARMPRADMNEVMGFDFPLPPLQEQQRIVGILDEAFECIATAKSNAETNLKNARAIFDSHLQDIFTKRGEGWSYVRIEDVAEVFDGPHATPKTVDVGPIFLGISALQDGVINLSETRHLTEEDFKTWTRRVKPQVDDIVFSYETRLGQASIIPNNLDCCLGRRMGLVRINKKIINPRFFLYQYISPPFRAFLHSKTVRGATVDRISLREFPSFIMKVPNVEEQGKIANTCETIYKETKRLTSIYQQKLAALDALKKSLLHKAFSGEL